MLPFLATPFRDKAPYSASEGLRVILGIIDQRISQLKIPILG